MLEIKNLYCNVAKKEILKNLNLSIKPGEVHCIMGPNGVGKSTLGHVIVGSSHIEGLQGQLSFDGSPLESLDLTQRSLKGIFMCYQSPVEIPGVNSMTFLKAIAGAKAQAAGEKAPDSVEFLKAVKEYCKELNIPQEMLRRPINSGFSGGEKKRFEILQMLILQPKLVILDELDSGLDVDTLQVLAKRVSKYLTENGSSAIVITHYYRLLEYLKPSHVHIISDGKIHISGNIEIAAKLEAEGYKAFSINQEQEAASG